LDVLDQLQTDDDILLKQIVPETKFETIAEIYQKRTELYKYYARRETDRAIKMHIYSRLENIYAEILLLHNFHHLHEIDRHLQNIDDKLMMILVSIRDTLKQIKYREN
jgi:hypothetical protein